MASPLVRVSMVTQKRYRRGVDGATTRRTGGCDRGAQMHEQDHHHRSCVSLPRHHRSSIADTYARLGEALANSARGLSKTTG